MNEHWKEDDVLRAVAQGKTWQQEQHAGECVACREEERWLEGALSNFRASMHAYSAQVAASASMAQRREAKVMQWAFRFAAALIVLLAVIGVPAYRAHRDQQEAKQIALREQQDAQLLESIDEQVSYVVPNAFQPLAQAAEQSAQTKTRK